MAHGDAQREDGRGGFLKVVDYSINFSDARALLRSPLVDCVGVGGLTDQ